MKKEPTERLEKLDLNENKIQQIFLSKFLSNPDYATFVCDNFDARWFDNKNIQKIFEISLSYYKKYSMIPSEKVLKLLFEKIADKGEFKKIELDLELDSAIGTRHDEYDDKFIKDKILEFTKMKSAYLAILDSISIVETKDAGKDKIINQCISKFQKILGMGVETEVGLNYLEDIDKHCEELANPESRLSTGFRQLDKVTNGGFYADGRCLIVFLGQPGLGKSVVLSNIAKNMIVAGKFPLILSLEMSEFVYASRIDAHLIGEDVNHLAFNIKKIKDFVSEFKKLHPSSKLIIKEFPPASINCNHIKAYIDKLHQMNMKPDALLVDYINLLKPNTTSNGDNTYVTIGNIAKELRALSYQFNIPVISASQVNRSGYDTSDIGMENTSDSAGINFHSDFIGALYQVEGDREANKLNMVVLKNRLGGQIGKVLEFFMNYKTLGLTDFCIEEQPNNASIDAQIVKELESL